VGVSLVDVTWESFSRLLQHPWKKKRGAILSFCPGHHTELTEHKHTHTRDFIKYLHFFLQDSERGWGAESNVGNHQPDTQRRCSVSMERLPSILRPNRATHCPNIYILRTIKLSVHEIHRLNYLSRRNAIHWIIIKISKCLGPVIQLGLNYTNLTTNLDAVE
jgi:hypothetical protein